MYAFFFANFFFNIFKYANMYILTFPKVSLKVPQFFPCFLAFPVISDIIGDIDIVSVSLASETCSDTDTSNTDYHYLVFPFYALYSKFLFIVDFVMVFLWLLFVGYACGYAHYDSN